MSSPLLEIVELEDGEFVLRRADEESEPLLSIRFSDESIQHLDNERLEIVKSMIEAGMNTAGELAEQKAIAEDDGPKTLH